MLGGIEHMLHWPVAEGGAGGIVYLADDGNGRVVAVKLHIPHADPNDFPRNMRHPAFVAEAAREAERQMFLAGPLIAQLHSFTPATGPFSCMSVMELVRDSLLELVQRRLHPWNPERFATQGLVSDADARELFRQVLDAARHLLHLGCVHGDIKWENVLVSTYGPPVVLKLCDLGKTHRCYP
eukprot:2637802-Prymnesium_polylepis.1